MRCVAPRVAAAGLAQTVCENHRMTTGNEIRIAAALITRADGKILLVRKRGSTAFMQAGGKIEADETPIQALCRELKEELHLEVAPADPAYLGAYRAPAANEPGMFVSAELFRLELSAQVEPAAELEEVWWMDPAEPGNACIAPLTREFVFALHRASR